MILPYVCFPPKYYFLNLKGEYYIKILLALSFVIGKKQENNINVLQ